MVMDATAELLFHQPCDYDGGLAAAGLVNETMVAESLRRPFFRAGPPKTAGREEFGREFARKFIQKLGAGRRESKKHDALATATALTVRSIAGAIERFVLPVGGFSEL